MSLVKVTVEVRGKEAKVFEGEAVLLGVKGEGTEKEDHVETAVMGNCSPTDLITMLHYLDQSVKQSIVEDLLEVMCNPESAKSVIDKLFK